MNNVLCVFVEINVDVYSRSLKAFANVFFWLNQPFYFIWTYLVAASRYGK